MQETEANERKSASSQNELKQSLGDTTSPLTGADPVQQIGEIPKFDLAEQIMAGQRKITAIRRKAPGKPQRLPSQDGAAGQKTKAPDRQPQAQSISYAIKQPPPTRTSQRSAASQSSILSGQEQIIAEIVARDIEKLYWGGQRTEVR